MGSDDRSADAGHQRDVGSDNAALIDPVVLVQSVWRFRYFVVLTSILGAVFGVMFALSTPHKYVAVNQFVLDPRELWLTDTDFLPQSFSSESILALVDSQVEIVDSSLVLRAVVDDLGLADVAEFNGVTFGGIGSTISLLREILTGKGASASDRNFVTLQALERAVSVYRGERTFILYVSVKTENADRSAEIANKIVAVYIEKQQEAQSALFERTSASFATQLDALRDSVETAERRVERYKAENDLLDAGGSLISDEEIIRLNQQLATVRAQKVKIQVKAESARRLDIDSILSGTSAEILESTIIGELRTEYASTKRAADSLATSLGPRHPQRISIEHALSTSRAEVNNELRRIVEATLNELRRAIQSEQQLAADLAILKSKLAGTSGDLVRLRELEREANATSAIYESFLKRVRETREQQSLNTSNIRVISAATAPLKPSSVSRKIIAIGGLMAGFFAGLAFAFIWGIYRSLSASYLGADRSRGAREGQSTQRREPQRDLYEPDPSNEVSLAADNLAEETGPFEPVEENLLVARDWSQQPQNTGDHQYHENLLEEENIRADIRQMRETVERLQRARRTARQSGNPLRG